MCKKCKGVLALIIGFLFVTNVNAEECSYKRKVELNDIASAVKVTYKEYEIDTGEVVYNVDEEKGELEETTLKSIGFKVVASNVTDDIYLTVKNEKTGSYTTVHSTDLKDGVAEIARNSAEEIQNYTITVESADSNCSTGTLRTINITTPMYNVYSELPICEENPKYELCQKYFSYNSNVTIDDVMDGAKKYEETKETIKDAKKEKKSIVNILKKYIKYISVTLIVIGGLITVISVIRKRRRLI